MAETQYNTKKQGERLLEFRLSIGKTQLEFANDLQTDKGSISNYENGKRKITAQFLSKLKTYNPTINIRWILSGEGEMFETGMVKEDMPIYKTKGIPLFSTAQAGHTAELVTMPPSGFVQLPGMRDAHE